MRKTPRVSISLAGSGSEEFDIEELTFNPFLESATSKGERGPATVWMEIHLRRRGKGGDELRAPDILLTFSHGSITEAGPTCDLEMGNDGPERDRDLNFVLHSDIWYSFVRVGDGEDREFMTTGYKMPVRVLYSCQKCRHHNDDLDHITAEPWITRNHVIFSTEDNEAIAKRILAEAQTFNRVLGSGEPTSHFLPVDPFLPFQSRIRLFRLKNQSRFAPVLFEEPSVPPKGRFAVRRLPWIADTGSFKDQPESVLYGISYGASARVSRDGEAYRVRPVLFSVSDSSLVEPFLAHGEGLRFWLTWRCPSAVDVSYETDRLTFSHQLQLDAPVHYVNSFLRMPTGFEHLPGSITPYKNYSVPPRLFFLWDHGPPNQCLANSTIREAPEAPEIVELQAEFHDRDRQRKSLVDLFIVVFMLNIMTSVIIADVYFDLQDDTGTLFNGAIWRGASVAFLFSLLAAIRLYRGKPVRKVFLVSFTMLSLLCSIIHEVLVSLGLPLSFILGHVAISVMLAGALLHLAFSDRGATSALIKSLLGPRSLSRLIKRRKFLNSVQVGFLDKEGIDA